MNLLREAITVGLSERATAGIKVRQPLHKATVWNLLYGENDFLKSFYEEIVKEELNVKSVEFKRAADEKAMSSPNPSITLDLRITPELKREGLMREVIRNVQNARKQAGLNVDDRITLSLHADDSELSKALQEHKDKIGRASWAVSTAKKVTDAFTQEVKVEGMLLTITLARHA
jgi:valyl-tRNA synthetase